MRARTAVWEELDLVRRLGDVLEVAQNVVDCLAGDGYVDPDAPNNGLRPEKVIAESALLMYAASTASRHPPIRERVHALAMQLAPHARSERMVLGACVEPALAWEYAQAHVMLSRLGYPCRRFDEVLERVCTARAHRGRERPPYRALEQAWIARISPVIGHRTTESPGRAPPVARQSTLATGMDLLSGSRDDVYAFTHGLMYLRGFTELPMRLPRRRSAILGDAEAAIARCLDEEDYDLGGEVLLAWPLTGHWWSNGAAFAFRVLANVEDQAGFLPSAGTRPERLAGLHGEPRRRCLLATAYHTVYVMGLLCAAALLPGRAPPTVIRGRGDRPGTARTLLDMLDGDERRPQWRRAIDDLPDASRESLAGLLMSIGLRRSVVRRDFAMLREFLRVGAEGGLANRPAALQAAELLDRLRFAMDPSRFDGRTAPQDRFGSNLDDAMVMASSAR